MAGGYLTGHTTPTMATWKTTRAGKILLGIGSLWSKAYGRASLYTARSSESLFIVVPYHRNQTVNSVERLVPGVGLGRASFTFLLFL